jgi:hypothetical protein
MGTSPEEEEAPEGSVEDSDSELVGSAQVTKPSMPIMTSTQVKIIWNMHHRPFENILFTLVVNPGT